VALAPLATAADLSARSIDITNTGGVAAQLAAASASVRAAAEAPITRATSTVKLLTQVSRRIELPARPVVSVATVLLAGVPVTDYSLRGSTLWRERDWQRRGDIPSEIVVTFTYGLVVVPEDIVDLVCSLAGAGLAAIEDGFKAHTGTLNESIDDYRVGYATGADAVVSLMELPERTKAALAKRFGNGGATVVRLTE
jgi:hypothetical protein